MKNRTLYLGIWKYPNPCLTTCILYIKTCVQLIRIYSAHLTQRQEYTNLWKYNSTKKPKNKIRFKMSFIKTQTHTNLYGLAGDVEIFIYHIQLTRIVCE